MRPTHVTRLLLLAIVCFAGVVRLMTIDREFARDPEGCGSFYGLLARNYFRYDLSKTLGAPVQSMGVHENPTLYPNHPPLVPLLIAAGLAMAGYTSYDDSIPPEWLVRFPTVLFTLGCIVLVYHMLRRDHVRAALIAACIFATVPMTLYFGGMPDVISPQLDFFILLTVIAYLKFHQRQSTLNLALLSLTFLPAILTDWPAIYMVPILCAHFAFTRQSRSWWWITLFGFFGIVGFLIPYLQVVLVTHDWKWIITLVQRRALSNIADSNTHFSFMDWINKALLGHAVARHTWPVMLLAMIWLGRSALRRNHSGFAERATLLVFSWAILHIIVGRQGVFVHEWWWWPLTPAVAMAAGLMLEQICTGLQAGMNRRMMNGLLVAAMIIFATFHTRAAFIELSHPKHISDNPMLDYSIVEMGEVIRASAPLNQAVMLAESDQTMSLWYYADRPLRRGIWDEFTFEKRLADDSSDLLFGLSERWTRRPVSFIFPKAYRSDKTESFVRYLQARYPMSEDPRFLIFDLNDR